VKANNNQRCELGRGAQLPSVRASLHLSLSRSKHHVSSISRRHLKAFVLGSLCLIIWQIVNDVQRKERARPAPRADAQSERRAPPRRIELDKVVRAHARPTGRAVTPLPGVR
jgi:hypothetical protein